MAETDSYDYMIIGAGLAGASAIEGIRSVDPSGSAILIGEESHLPYHRPPLSKKLWTGEKKVSGIIVHDLEFYDENGVDLTLGMRAVHVNPATRTVTLSKGDMLKYGKLLLCTGGIPRRLSIPGGDLDGICYYRRLDDYWKLRSEAQKGARAVIVGGGYIGSEIAAALNMQGVDVTMIIHGKWPGKNVFPEGLGRAIRKEYADRGVKFVDDDEPSRIDKKNGDFIIETRGGKKLESHIVVVGIGVQPAVALAEKAGLETANGVVVNNYMQSSNPDIYAAGDIVNFPYLALGQRMRIEHWDHALNSGKYAGRNMAGEKVPYDYMPYFFSDLYDFGYEAVGEISTGLETYADWKEENRKGVVYYMRDGVVRGVMMCNVWDKVDAARELIRAGQKVAKDDLKGAIA